MIEYELAFSMRWNCTVCAAKGSWSCDGCEHIPASSCESCPKEIKDHVCHVDVIVVPKAEWDQLKKAQGKRRTYQREYMQKRRAKKSPNQGA